MAFKLSSTRAIATQSGNNSGGQDGSILTPLNQSGPNVLLFTDSVAVVTTLTLLSPSLSCAAGDIFVSEPGNQSGVTTLFVSTELWHIIGWRILGQLAEPCPIEAVGSCYQYRT